MSNTINPQSWLCELCNHEPRRDSRLCASCADMISRLVRIAGEVEIPVPPQVNTSDETTHAELARLYERALKISTFTVTEYRP